MLTLCHLILVGRRITPPRKNAKVARSAPLPPTYRPRSWPIALAEAIPGLQLLQNLAKIAKNILFEQNFRNFPKMSEHIRTHPNASERVRTHPNGSEQVRTGPNRSERVRKHPKTSKTIRNHPKKSEKIRKFRDRRANFSDAALGIVGIGLCLK